MKLWWIMGCIHGCLHFVGNALDGKPEWGEWAWLSVTLDLATALMFALAIWAAFRTRAPWMEFPSQVTR